MFVFQDKVGTERRGNLPVSRCLTSFLKCCNILVVLLSYT